MDFLFNNIKCLELFKYDFTDQKETNENGLARNPIDMELFTPTHQQSEVTANANRAQRPLSLRELLLKPSEDKSQVETYNMKPVV